MIPPILNDSRASCDDDTSPVATIGSARVTVCTGASFTAITDSSVVMVAGFAVSDFCSVLGEQADNKTMNEIEIS